MATPNIHTRLAKPGPLRMFDWEAWLDGNWPDGEGHMTMGFGRTEAEAIASLQRQLEGRT